MDTIRPAPNDDAASRATPPATERLPCATTDADWILVAGATQARLYRRSRETPGLILVREFAPPQLRVEPRDEHVHESEGQSRQPLSGMRHWTPMSPQRRRHLQFAGVLAAFVEHGLNAGQCDRLVLISGCPFLGALRRSLSPNARRAASVVIDQDLCDLTPDALAHVIEADRRLAA